MRPALQRLLANPSALGLLRKSLLNDGALSQCSSCTCQHRGERRQSTLAILEDERNIRFLNQPGEAKNSSIKITKGATLRLPSSSTPSTGSGPHEPNSKEEGSEDLRTDLAQDLRSLDHCADHERWALCLGLVRSRWRQSRPNDVKFVFDAVSQRSWDLPVFGPIADELWHTFVSLGLNDQRFLLRVVQYAEDLKTCGGGSWSRLYGFIVAHLLRTSSKYAVPWHRRLQSSFPPTKADYEKLFNLSVSWGGSCLTTFEEIYKECPIRDMYSVIIQELCRRKQYLDATRWHFILLNAGDTPESFEACKPLLVYYSKVRDEKQVESLVKSLIKSEASSEKTIDSFVHKREVVTRETLNRALGKAYGIRPKTITDQFCARLFATKVFSIDLVISGLGAIGTEIIGPASLREIVIRDACNGERICRHIDKLREAGINLDNSKYTMILRKAALENRTNMLELIVHSDLHPETFEDGQLQERLLAMYYEKQDSDQISRTLYVLLAFVADEELATRHANLMLRCFISLQNRSQVLRQLHKMLHDDISLTSKSAIAFRLVFLRKRRVTCRPRPSKHELKDLTVLINLMKRIIASSGELIPIDAWREILRRLGMLGRLEEYENLAIWLVRQYTEMSSRFEAQQRESIWSEIPKDPCEDAPQFSQQRLTSNPADSSNMSAFLVPPSKRAPNQHLLSLFGHRAQQAIIAWGFQNEVKRSPSLTSASRQKISKTSPDWQWGLRLLKVLQELGLPVEEQAIAAACKQRLSQLFSRKVRSKRIINRHAQQLNALRAQTLPRYRYLAYVKAMKAIWGEGLFGDGIYQNGMRVVQGEKWDAVRTENEDIRVQEHSRLKRIGSTVTFQ